MKLKHLIASGFAICGLLTGCLSEPDLEPTVDGGIPIRLDGSISQVSTKVNAQGFEDGDALGLYAVNYENGNQTPGTLKDKGNQADHVKYVLDEKNGKWTPVKPVYYKDVNTNVDLYAFYPHAEPSSVSEYNFEVQKDQSTKETASRLGGYEASDFLWGKAENIAPTEASIKVTLNHMMAGAHVILKEGTGFEEAGDFALIDKKVLVSNTTRKASIDLSNGHVTPIGGAQATGIVMAPQSDGSFRAVVVPQKVAANATLFSITIDGQAYSFTRENTHEYVAGKLSQFTITVNRKYPSGQYELVLGDTQIIDWKEDINTHEGEARQYYCVHCDQPGTLEDRIKDDNKNPAKIKNIKVTGVISDEDFYFMRDKMDILEAVNLKECKIVDVQLGGEDILWGYKDAAGHDTIFSVREIGTYDDIIPDYAFLHKRSLNYFVFPEKVTDIGHSAFNGTSLNGALVIPNDVTAIWQSAFGGTNISSVSFSEKIEIIADGAFTSCTSLTGTLYLPSSIEYIGSGAFENCAFTGNLFLPNSLKCIKNKAFRDAGQFTGGLIIPDGITCLEGETFYCSKTGNHPFTGTLDLNNVQSLEWGEFYGTKFSGELVIPEGITDIPTNFCYNIWGGNFTSIIFPSTIKSIGSLAFPYMSRLTDIYFPEGLHTIGERAFEGCSTLQSLELPSTMQTIQENAFSGGFNIGSIISHAPIPPTIIGGAFDGVPKENFTVEVPESAVLAYQADRMWGQFNRISSHHDFSISRHVARALNDETAKKYILRAPANESWSIESKPDWITVTPSEGTGRTEVTVTFAKMSDAEVETFESIVTDNNGWQETKTYNGRTGKIVFLLKNKDFRSRMTVEQYDYEYGDGDAITLQTASKGKGVNLVFLADCYDAKDIADGSYLKDVQEAYGYYFNVEPYKTYKDYFNVYTVIGESNDSGMGTVNTVRDAKFDSQYSLEGISPDFETAYEYAKRANQNIDPTKTLVVMVENTTEYGGICYMWGDGTAIACCPKSMDTYPYDFRGIVQHEAGGHGFGKLADEYIYVNAFVSSCGCTNSHLAEFESFKSLGWYRNLESTGDIEKIGWSHLFFNPDYSDRVDIFEGGYYHTRGIFRSEQLSCMNNNVPYFSAISRQAIVERIMEYAGEEFTLEKFYANDSDEFGTTTRSFVDAIQSAPMYDNGKQFAPKYMGDKPDFIK